MTGMGAGNEHQGTREFSHVLARESTQSSLKDETFLFALVCTFLHFKNDGGGGCRGKERGGKGPFFLKPGSFSGLCAASSH